MSVQTMRLKILLPFQIFTEQHNVVKIVAETSAGSFGILPHRLDCVATLVAGILCYETKENGENYVAVDQGVLVKTGFNVAISVRNAIAGADLNDLKTAVRQQFLQRDAHEQQVRSVLAKLESSFTRRFMEFNRG